MFACIHAPERAAELLECALYFSPQIERTSDGTVVFDIDGVERMFGLPQEIAAGIKKRLGFAANIAVAQTPDSAICAARGFHGISVIPLGDEAKYLGGLPVALLDPLPEIAETLERWGIRRFRDLAALPENGIAERFGPEGLRLRKLARGTLDRPLVPYDAPPSFEETLELEYPVELLEPLSFILARLLNQLCARIEAVIELCVRLGLEDKTSHERSLRLPVPMRDTRVLLKLLQLDLASNPPQAPVTLVRISAEPAKARVSQEGMFIPLAPEPEKLEVTLARIEAFAGEGNAGSPELLDTHRPGAFRMKKFGTESPPAASAPAAVVQAAERNTRLAFRVFRPPLPATVERVNSRPAHVVAAGIRGKVTECGGPWRTSGDWWRPDAWARDEWDVALAGGALYRLFQNLADGHWFIEGSYD